MSNVTGGSSDNRSSRPSEGVRFDLSDERSTLQLLRAIHKSTLDSDTKNTLRDTVFAFRAEKGAVVTKELADLFAEHGFSLVPEEVSEASADASGGVVTLASEEEGQRKKKFGFSRPTPQFSPTLSSVTKKTESDTHTGENQGFAPRVTAMQQTEAQTEHESNGTNSVAATSEAPSGASQVPPASTKASENTASQEENIQSGHDTPTNAMERIKEIKRQVNALVDNPINLIDVHNDLGREYMNALLDAMKKSNGGSAQEVSDAMQRLERAFQDVKRMLTQPSESAGVASDTNITATAAAPEIPANDVQQEAAQIGTTLQEAPSKTKEQAQTKTDVVADRTEVSDTAGIQESTASAQHPDETPSKEGDVAEEKAHTPKSESLTATSENTTATTSLDTSVRTSLTSVAKAKQVEEMMIAQKTKKATDDKQQQEKVDPLLAPEVTDGLTQLLSEWELFKRSGLFGTGPNGIDHPLYKRLAPLTMAAVVAGRFEGVTPQIKRTIADAMNVWRYQEGIVHKQGETFEHYLRRVIKHLLDKRKQKT